MASQARRRALLVGHFSTFGDLEVLEVVKSWLHSDGIPFDVSPFTAKIRTADPSFVNPDTLDAAAYTHLIVICGPFTPRLYRSFAELFARFSECVWIGVNLTMIEPLNTFNPFDVLLERDSDHTIRPDLAFRHEWAKVPVVGLCLATRQSEYGTRRRHDEAAPLLRRVIAEAGAACVDLDTCWPPSTNGTAIENAAQFMSVCSKLDLVLTTRLHGLVLSLKVGTPVVALDAISGGDKLSKQATEVGWPEIFQIDNVTGEELKEAMERCLSPAHRERAAQCASRAAPRSDDLQRKLRDAFDAEPAGKILPKPYWLKSRKRKLLEKLSG